jgi:hypothetical protein
VGQEKGIEIAYSVWKNEQGLPEAVKPVVVAAVVVVLMYDLGFREYIS